MSTDATYATTGLGNTPELTPLGKRLELLRIQRGLSKQLLARRAGTSRQQLWRVMSGKSELTSALCERLADVLSVDTRSLRCDEPAVHDEDGVLRLPTTYSGPPPNLEAYLASAEAVRATLRTLPAGEGGRRLKRDLLNLIEELAHANGIRLSMSFLALRGAVLNGEL